MSKISLAIRAATALVAVAPLLTGCAVHEQAQVTATAPPPPEGQVDVKVDAPKPPVAVVVEKPPPPPPPEHPAVVVEQVAAHPHFLRALSDLRYARAALARRGGDRAMRWDEGVAIAEVDAAINEIKHAAIDDGKNLDDHPPIDARMARAGLLRQALSTLTAAHDDCMAGDERFGNGMRARAVKHIDEAIRLTQMGIRAAEMR